MENEIRVGEYVRDWNGQIARIIKINEYKTKPKVIYTDIIIDVNEDRACNENIIDEDTIVKHSSNLIDIIEVGDYVNGYKVTNVINKEPCPSGKCVDIDADRPSEYCTLWEDNIETVVTKEQFASITYKVLEKDWRDNIE